jgi:glycosyltransferase involved in cell wall biosynthesis
MKLKNLSVFSPAYNEEDNISATVREALRVIPRIAEEFEIIVVNDGSSDRTAERLSELLKDYPALRVITHPKNRGYGAALKSGFAHSRYDYIFYTDGDGQFDIAEIEKLIPLTQTCDIAAGFRLKRKDPPYRIFNAKAYNLLVRLLFGLSARDIDCAFKIIKRTVAKTIDLKSETQFISAEFLIRAKKQGFAIKQCGVRHLPREKGKATGNNPLVVITTFAELFKLWRELR